MKTKIDSKNLLPYVGKLANVYCQVGVLFSIQGTLRQGTLSDWKLELSNGDSIQFRYGEFTVTENGSVSIVIS